jgi:hypothetical protein
MSSPELRVELSEHSAFFLSDIRKLVCDGVGAMVTTGGVLLLDADWLFE